MDQRVSGVPPYTVQRVPSSDPIVLTTLLSLFDESVAWLTAKGVSAQWGSEPLANNENHIGKVKKIIEQCNIFLAHSISPDRKILGLAAYSSNRIHPEIIPPVEEPELYIQCLITARDDPKAKGVGHALVLACEQEALDKGVGLLRLDCFDGKEAKGALVKVYEGMGFKKMGPKLAYNKEGWMGQVLGIEIGAKDLEGELKGSG